MLVLAIPAVVLASSIDAKTKITEKEELEGA
jgi:hypothetical protein